MSPREKMFVRAIRRWLFFLRYDARRSNRQLPFCCQKLASLLYFFRLLAVLAANMKDGHTSSQHTQKKSCSEQNSKT